MNYIGTIMNKTCLLIIFFSFMYSNTNMYWDLGVAILPYSNKFNTTKSIDLSTFHRIEGLKKYYLDDFSGALFHFEELNQTNKELILYEYIDSHYSVGNYSNALSILDKHDFLSDNILYLKSKIFVVLGNYEAAIFVLEELKNNFPVSDYLDIIKFDLEKINLLK